jgi:putative tricarboxylic transport membrane protein
MSAQQGITMLLGVYVGGIAGGLVSAVLLNIPGSPAALVTCFDGSPMARNGRPADALIIGVFASLVGGLFSAVALILIAPMLAKVALVFGPWEYFAMGIMGLSVVISLCSEEKIKGFIAAIFGMLLAMVGIDAVSGVSRLSFGFWQMNAGLDILAVLMGLFAIAEILTQQKTLGREFSIIKVDKMRFWPRKESLKGTGRVFGIGSITGTLIGILPGIGQTTSSLLSYTTARQTSKHPEKYGTGIPEGIVASETANNSCCGGALIPMLTLGVPGDLVTAILLGGLIVHGLQPGPLLFKSNASIIGVIFVSFFLANIFMYLIELGMMRVFIKVLTVPLNILFPVILLMCVVGTITVNNRIFDSWVLLAVGIMGYFLANNNFPLAPVVLGFILGGIIENNLRTALLASQGNVLDVAGRPIALGLLIFGALMVIIPEILARRTRKRIAAAKALEEENLNEENQSE